jgi:hypothetical protein
MDALKGLPEGPVCSARGQCPLLFLLLWAHALCNVRSLWSSFCAAQRGVAVGVALQDQGAALKNQGAALQDQAQRLAEITRDLKSCRSEFFTEEQAAHSR